MTVVGAPAHHEALVAALREITHETRGAVGTIRLAMTTLLEEGIDEATRVELVTAADTEAVRLVAELAALPSLVAALVDESAPASVDLSAALRRAHRDVSGFGVAVRTRGRAALAVLGHPDSLDTLLGALIRFSIACGATEVTARAVDDDVVDLDFSGARQRGPLVRHLAAALHATLVDEPGADGFSLRFTRVAP